jgi:maltose/moltooligosaccharide transporter
MASDGAARGMHCEDGAAGAHGAATSAAATAAATTGLPGSGWRWTIAGLLSLAFWLVVGVLGTSMRERAAIPSALALLHRHATSDTATSLLMSAVPALLSILIVPWIGYRSDRSNGRWGRRRPYLLAVVAAGMASMLGLAGSPLLGAFTHAALGALSPGQRLCELAYFGLFWTTFECSALSTTSLFTGLVNDLVPRPLLGRVLAGLRIVSLSVGIAFNTWVFALTDQYLYEILFAIALAFGLPLLLMCAMVREAPAAGTDAAAGACPPAPLIVPAVRERLLACFADRSFLWSVAPFMLAAATFGPFNTFYQHYAHVSGISTSTLGTLTAYGYSISILSAFGIGALVDRYGAVRISLIAMCGYFTVAGIGYLWLADAASFRWFYLAHVSISGAYFTAAASMPMALFPRAQFVQYTSTKDVMVVVGNILVSAIQGPILDSSDHDYHLTLLSATLFSLACLGCLLRLEAGRKNSWRSCPKR